jgi:hypothetical protein
VRAAFLRGGQKALGETGPSQCAIDRTAALVWLRTIRNLSEQWRIEPSPQRVNVTTVRVHRRFNSICNPTAEREPAFGNCSRSKSRV